MEDIDKGLRLASGRKMGIFETGDLVGLDVTYGALMAMYQETHEERWYPPFLLRRKVKAGQLGRKPGWAGTATTTRATAWAQPIREQETAAMPEAVILSAVRTPVGRFGGTLKAVTDHDLGCW